MTVVVLQLPPDATDVELPVAYRRPLTLEAFSRHRPVAVGKDGLWMRQPTLDVEEHPSLVITCQELPNMNMEVGLYHCTY